MARGQAEPSGEAQRRFQLTDQLHLSHAAVTNWVKHSGGPAELDRARKELLDQIREVPDMTFEAPAWMTSPKPGVKAYIHLPDGLILTLVDNPDPDSRRRYLVSNCIAWKRGAKRPEERADAPTRPKLEGARLAELTALEGAQLNDRVRLSVHCLERFQSRAQTGAGPEDLRAAITSSGRVVAPAPAWANAAGHGGPGLICRWEGRELCLPLAPDGDGHSSAVATTCLPDDWARELEGVQGSALWERVRLSGRMVRKEGLARGRDDLEEYLQQQIVDHGEVVFELPAEFGPPGPLIRIQDRCWLRLRPGGAGSDIWAVDAIIGDLH